MELNTNFNDPFGCSFSLDKLYVYPTGTTAEAVDFGHGRSEIHRLTLNLTAPRCLAPTLSSVFVRSESFDYEEKSNSARVPRKLR